MADNTLINGIAADYLTVDDRAIHYGDGIFETLLCHNRRLLYWQQHYQRLGSSAKRLQLLCPDQATLLQDISILLENNTSAPCQTYSVKIILTRGSGERGYVYPENAAGNRLVFLSALDKNYSSLLTEDLSDAELYVCKQQVSINENLAGLKHLNRLENVLARNEWSHSKDKNRYVDGLMLNAFQHVIEGTMSNVFAVNRGELFTPDLKQSGVKGIMRDLIIKQAEANNISVSTVNLGLDDLLTMDELFITNSLLGIKSISKLAASIYTQTTTTNCLFNAVINDRDNYAQAV